MLISTAPLASTGGSEYTDYIDITHADIYSEYSDYIDITHFINCILIR